MVNNMNDGMVWGLIPLLLIRAGVSIEQIALIAAVYPGVWSMSQLVTGTLSDRWGRNGSSPLWVQAVGINFRHWRVLGMANRCSLLGMARQWCIQLC
jgi:MFS family permease